MGAGKDRFFHAEGVLEKLALGMLNSLPLGCTELLFKGREAAAGLKGTPTYFRLWWKQRLLVVPRTDPERLYSDQHSLLPVLSSLLDVTLHVLDSGANENIFKEYSCRRIHQSWLSLVPLCYSFTPTELCSNHKSACISLWNDTVCKYSSRFRLETGTLGS